MRTVRDILEIVLIALVLSLIIRSFVAERFIVEGHSMQPTLHDKEMVLVLKVAYKVSPVRRGDVVVFKYPFDTSKDYIKRVVALGGDTVQMRLGRVYVNGQLQEESFVRSPGFFDMESRQIPEGAVFVMGDNRTDSEDSRSFGPVSTELIKGKVVVRIWPVKAAGRIK